MYHYLAETSACIAQATLILAAAGASPVPAWLLIPFKTGMSSLLLLRYRSCVHPYTSVYDNIAKLIEYFVSVLQHYDQR